MTEVRRGRPRSEETRRAILAATRDLLTDTGYDALTFDAVARLASSSRQTLYRWWPSKSLLVADAVLEGAVVMDDAALPDTGDLAADLTHWLTGVLQRSQNPLSLSLVRALAAASAEDDAHADALYAALTGMQHDQLVARIAADSTRQRHVDPETTADALLGIPLFHALSRRRAQPDAATIVRSLLG